ncbi:MAG: hypothetical protein ACTJHZ_08460 [Vagococcus sp.]
MELFIVFSANNSLLSRAIKHYTKETYNHVSLSLDKSLNETYSFGRKKITNPLIGGFVQENFWDPFFLTSECAIYSIEVTDVELERVTEHLQYFKENEHYFQYNFLGLLALSIEFNLKRDYAYFCSEFIATILQNAGIIDFEKATHFVTPVDLLSGTTLKKEYEGKMIDYLSLAKKEVSQPQFSIA